LTSSQLLRLKTTSQPGLKRVDSIMSLLAELWMVGRFDIEINTHNSENPALRRINSPAEISDACYDVRRNNSALDIVAQIFGPNIKQWTNKINLKLPTSGTEVKFHQDFPFEPH